MSIRTKIKNVWDSVRPGLVTVVMKSTTGIMAFNKSFPVIAKTIVDKMLHELPGFDGSIGSASLHVLRGTVEVTDVVLNKKITRETSTAFVRIPKITLSFNWKQLLSRQFVGDMVIEQPTVIIDAPRWTTHHEPAPPHRDRRLHAEPTWQTVLKRMPAFKLGTVAVKNADIKILHLGTADADVIPFKNLNIRFLNLSNSVTLSPALLARAEATAEIISGGYLEFHAEGFPLDPKPSFTADLRLQGIQLADLKIILRHYFEVDISEGSLEVVAEMEAKGGEFKGYAKPIFDHLRIETVQRPDLFARMKSMIAKTLVSVLRNPKMDRIATRINFEGSWSDPEVSFLTTVGNFIKNSFGTAFHAHLEHHLLDSFRSRPDLIEFSYSAKPKTSLWKMLKESFTRWMRHEVPRMSAALSYYTCFSLAPLLLLLIAVCGLVFGRAAAQGQILDQLTGLVGRQSAQTIQTMIAAAWQPSKGIFAAIVSIVTLIVGAFGVLSELKTGLNRVMATTEPEGIGEMVFERAKFLGFILGIGFLLMVSLAVSAGLAAFGQYLGSVLPFPRFILQIIDGVLSIGVFSVLFAMIFRYLPNKTLSWRSIWVGSGFTAILFTVGKAGLGSYLGRSSTASSYGAAGSILIVLLWVYYSSLILYYGAEFTKVYSDSTEALR